MNEAYFSEIEKALLFVSEARKRAGRSATTIERAGADEHLVEAMRDLEKGLAELHRLAMQQTYFAVPDDNALFAASRHTASE